MYCMKKIAKNNAVRFHFFIVWKQAKLSNICWGFVVAAFSEMAPKEPCLLVFMPLCNRLPHCYQSCVWLITNGRDDDLSLPRLGYTSVCLSVCSLITHCAGSQLPVLWAALCSGPRVVRIWRFPAVKWGSYLTLAFRCQQLTVWLQSYLRPWARNCIKLDY